MTLLEKTELIQKACNEFLNWKSEMAKSKIMANFRKQKDKCIELQKKYRIKNNMILKIFDLNHSNRVNEKYGQRKQKQEHEI
jgi:hypothetical protein